MQITYLRLLAGLVVSCGIDAAQLSRGLNLVVPSRSERGTAGMARRWCGTP